MKGRGKAAILISKEWTIYFLTGPFFVFVVDVGYRRSRTMQSCEKILLRKSQVQRTLALKHIHTYVCVFRRVSPPCLPLYLCCFHR